MSGRVLIALLTLFGRAPLPALRALGWLLGQVLYGLAGSRRRIVLTNLGLCFPDLDPGARKRLARRTLVAFAQSWLDRGWLWHAPEKTLLQRLRLQGALFELEGNRPVVLFAPHFMGLDAAWTALTLRLPRRLVTIYSPQKSAATDRWMHTGRQRWGQPTQVPRGDGVRPVLQALRAGQPLYLLPDMNFDPSESLFVPFFGVTACTVTSLPKSEVPMPRGEMPPIIYEDEHLIAVDKPAGLVVHPAAGHWSGTLLNGLLAHHAGAAALPRAGIVHRLDKDTSGLMLVARTLVAQTALVRAIADRSVHREYVALVHGDLKGTAPGRPLRIDAAIGRDPVSRVKMALVASGKPAMTDVVRLGGAEVPVGPGGSLRPISAVHCKLHTGRTHQIRVHLASRGHPLLADAMYGGAAALGLTRQALHAARLSLDHPVDGRALRFEAALPSDLSQAWLAVCGAPCEGLPAWDYNPRR